MSTRAILILCTSLFLCSCVQAPVYKGEAYAIVSSNYPIKIINDIEIESSFKLDINAGENTLIIVYRTYLHDYLCTFTWTAEAGNSYEVTDQNDKYPLTLYRWIRTNRFWASRLDPINPSQCVAH